MNALIKNNIVTNPKGWAGRAVGSPVRYRLLQSYSIIVGLCLAVIFALLSPSHLPVGAYLSVFLLLLLAVVVLPLCYLRALRSFVVTADVTAFAPMK